MSTRLSVSPAMEIAYWLRLTASLGRHPVFGDPGAGARAALAHRDVALLLDLMPPNGTSYTPDLLTPQPGLGPPDRVLDDQLATIASTTQHDMYDQLFVHAETCGGRPPTRRVRQLADTGRLQRRLASGVARFWREALDAGWRHLRSTLEHDIAERTAIMGRHGVGHLLDTLHPKLARRGGTLVLQGQSAFEIDIRGREFVIAPVALGRLELVFQVDCPGQAVLYYPASGIGGHASTANELGRVLGVPRSALLTDLGTARSTTELGARHGYSPSTISYHLNALHRAGLVTKHREGRFVLYTRTAHASTLLGQEPVVSW